MSVTYISDDAMLAHASIIIDDALDVECKKIDLQLLMDKVNEEMVSMQDAHGGALRIFTMPAYMALEAQWVQYHREYMSL